MGLFDVDLPSPGSASLDQGTQGLIQNHYNEAMSNTAQSRAAGLNAAYNQGQGLLRDTNMNQRSMGALGMKADPSMAAALQSRAMNEYNTRADVQKSQNQLSGQELQSQRSEQAFGDQGHLAQMAQEAWKRQVIDESTRLQARNWVLGQVLGGSAKVGAMVATGGAAAPLMAAPSGGSSRPWNSGASEDMNYGSFNQSYWNSKYGGGY
jgi:hypothetical protein